MKVIKPGALTTAMVAATSVPADSQAAWAVGTTYAKGQQITRSGTHRIWESAADTNKGNDPAAAGQTAWIDIGPTNRWAMFDQAVGTSSSATGTIDVTLAPGAVSALAVSDTNAETVRVRMTVGGTAIYDRTLTTNVSGGVIADWYAYFTAPIGKLMTVLFLDLPLYATAQVEVTITGPDPQAPVTVGTLLVGTLIDLGSTETGPTVGMTDYSKKTTDDFGVTTIVQRAWAKKAQLKALVATDAVDGIQRSLAGVRALPCLWIGEGGYDCLAIYGFFNDFSIELTVGMDPDTRSGGISYVSLTIEGLI
ncbi:hypothetical protein [Sphingomonas sp.]|uniref:hypothetical protein n=1 Tax=Sphingomonas sp. TaxID=28214 RepID=UPI003B00D7D9